ncbi:hypothetical protein CC1G_13980 [Coprinopsis cinerea okayama7|uniref:Uncharacterized protein n=1 Tax=Coprinopsis cinerea (strain Okayama-7 / 130 / ATCC MYA-4618 / FGSC 9003) TaxID=240176 RepID=D6RKR9_COPC7|nr:hypothetical protein CC1G_13980 [Coprinopsis cinerea okayama7\|eukprot:XP_002911941.1 hypothetical protein CC1G_13980 [Coprinopsis cinerea okayama7\
MTLWLHNPLQGYLNLTPGLESTGLGFLPNPHPLPHSLTEKAMDTTLILVDRGCDNSECKCTHEGACSSGTCQCSGGK